MEWERGKGRVGSGDLTIINHHHLSQDKAVQCAAVGGWEILPWTFSTSYPTVQQCGCQKMSPQSKFKDKMHWFVRCTISEMGGSLLKSGNYCSDKCWSAAPSWEPEGGVRTWSSEDIPPSCLLIYSVINIHAVEILKLFLHVVIHLHMNSSQRPDAGQCSVCRYYRKRLRLGR